MPKPSGTYLKPYEGKEIVATQVINGVEQKVHTGQDARTVLELRTGPQGQENGPALEPFRPAWGFSKLYSAWKALKEDPNHPLPEWNEYLDGLTSDAAAADAFINGKEQFLTLEPTVISPSHDDANSLVNNEIIWSQIVNNVSKIEEYARREEFLPPDASVREDYRVLTDVLRNAVREGENLVRMAVWLEQIEKDPDMAALLSRRNTSGMTKAQRDFWNAYRLHRADESGSVNKNKMLSAVIYWTQSAELDGEILEYAWGDGAGNLAGSLKGFSTDYAGGADRANAWLLYYSLVRSGIDPDSMVPFLQNLRNSGLKQRMENREYDEAVLHLAAWKEDDARDISRFAQELTAASAVGNLSPSDRERLLRDRLSDPAALSESARQTLAANFDRTFNKYFSTEQMQDGSAFSHIRMENASMADVLRYYAGETDTPEEAMRMAKAEMMVRILTGEPVDLEKVLPDGTVKRRADGTAELAPLRVETVQSSLERTVASAARNERVRRAQTAARRFDMQRPDAAGEFMGGNEPVISDEELRDFFARLGGNSGGRAEDAAERRRMFASLAQAYLLSQRPDIRMADLTYSPSAIAEEKLSAGLEVAGAIRSAVRSEDWGAYDRIAGDVAYMIPRMDMKQELASAMYLDHGREQPYFQDEFRRLMASPANSPRVGALLASTGRFAQDIDALCTVRLTHRSETQREFQRSCRTLEAIGEREGQWLNEELSRPARQAAEDPERDARSAANRQAAEKVRSFIAVDGVLPRNTELINDLQIPEEEDRLRPSGAYLRSYGGKKQKEYVLMPDGSRQRGPDGKPLIREKAEDMRALLEPAAGPNGEELKPQFATAQPAWAFSRLYSAWKNMMDTTEYVRKVPEWETVAAGMQSNTDLANQIAGRNPRFLALDPTFAVASTYSDSVRNYVPNMEAVAERSAAVEEYARRAEFMPADPAIRDDYRVLTDVFRNLVREMDELMRMDAWLEQIDHNRGVQYLCTRDRKRLTPEQRAFVDEYNRQRFGNGESDGIGSLDRDMIEAASGQLEEALKMTEGLLRYAWGETDETLEQVLRGFDFDSRGGAEERPGYTLYYELIRAGIDPDSIRPLVERLRAENIGRRMEERRFDEAVMQLSAWREADAAEIERFAQRIAQEIGTAEPSGAEAARRLRELANGGSADAPAANASGATAGVLSANARATLAANFDRTFGKYFSPQQMSDGTAYRHIRVGGTDMLTLVQSYDNASSASLLEAEEKAKVELMTRLLAGDRIEVEKVLPDGKIVPRYDGAPSRALLRVETSQRSLGRTLEIVEATVGAREAARAGEAARQAESREEARRQETVRATARVREERAGNQRQEFRQLRPAERKARLNRDFTDAYEELMTSRRIASSDQDARNVLGQGYDRAKKELAADGIFDVLAHSALGAREVADIQRAFRGLEAYQASVPAAQAEVFGRCMDLLRRNWGELDQIRYEQEFMRIYPEMGEYLERNARVPVSEGQRPGQAADERMNEEAEKLYRASMMLVQMLRYGVGDSTAGEWQNYFLANDISELEELLEEEGSRLEDFVAMADALHDHIPAAGNRFAAADGIPADMGAMDAEIFAELTSSDAQSGLGRLEPEARQWAAQSFDPVFGRVFGSAERERLAARGMDIYDCIFVDGRSLSDLYRETPERRSYEKMESDMKCRFMQHMLAGARIDVMAADAAGQEKLIPMWPYDSTGTMAESSRVPVRPMPHRLSEDEEDLIRDREEESRRRLGDLLSDPKARRDRTEHIRYARRDREAAPVPERRGLAVPFAAVGAENAVITTALPIGDQRALLSSEKYGGNDGPIFAECLSALWGLQSHRPGGLSGGVYSTRRLRMPADPDRSAEDRRGFEVLQDTFEMTDEMFANILRMTAADIPDRRTMDLLGIRAPEQLFYIDGKSVEEYMRGIPEYADMEPDYRPDSEYLRIFRAEVISATLGGVSPVDIASPEADPVSGNVRSNVRELRVDYSRLPVAMARDRAGLIAAMADRQSYQWGGPRPEGQEGLAHIYPEQFTKEARGRRQEQIAGNIRRNFTPLIHLPGGSEGELTQQQRADYAAVRELSDDRIVNMDSANVERAYPVYEEIRRQLGLGDQETGLLAEAGVVTCEAELFYIDGVSAAEYLWRNRAALRDNNGDPYPDVVASADRQLKAEIAAIAISGRHIVEVGRVAMDAAGNLRAGVTDVHVDLAPLDGRGQDPNAALRASRANRDQESRRERIRGAMQARIDRAAEISYTDGEDMFYRSAARRFDRNRPDMTDDYIFDKTAAGNRMRELFGSEISDEEAGRLVSSMAQMYLLSKDEKYHLSDLADPESLKNEKRDAGREVSEALREGVENGNWQAFDAIAARVSRMVHPTEPAQGQTLPQQPGSVRRLDMKEELAAVMGLDLGRNPAYSQEEFLRLMDSPENSPYVSAVLAYAGHLAGDTLTIRYSMQHELPFAADGADAEATDTLYAIRLVGEHEEQWLNEAQNFRRRADFLSGQRVEEIADLRMSLEDTRRIVAGNGIRHENTLQISGILNQGLRPRIRRTGRELSGQLVRDLAERPFADLGLTDYAYPAVTVAIPQQFNTRTGELGDLVSLANRNRGVDPAGDGMTAAYASMLFDQMFTGGSDPVFGTAYRNRLSAEGMDPLDRIYIEGRSVNDLYREKYRDLAMTDPKRAMDCMKTEFMIRLLQGARIDVAAEQNGVEILSAMALQTDIRDFNRRAWLTVPRGEENFPRFVGATEARQGFTVPPMTAEMAESIYESQWIAADRALRGGNAPALSAGQDGPETRRVRSSWEEKRSADRRDRLTEDVRTGQVADSIAYRMRMADDINETGGADIRNALFRLYADGEGEFKRIFGQNYTRTQDDNSLLNAASGWLDGIIKKATYGEAPRIGTETVPTRLQEMMGYSNTNMTDLFRIDGMTVKEYADAHGLSKMLEGENAETNRKAILASVLVGGEHHVDMIRSGLAANERGENVAYKTGVAGIQIDLSPFDGMVRFYQTRPSRKAERLYGDMSGRSERHQKIRQAADEQLFRALAAEQQEEEAQERRDLAAAAESDRLNRIQGARPAAAQPQPTPAVQPGTTQPAQNPAAQPGSTQPAPTPAAQSGPTQPTPAAQSAPARTPRPQPVKAPRLAPAPQPCTGLKLEDREIAEMLRKEGFQALCHDERRKSLVGILRGRTDEAWLTFGDLRRSLADRSGTPAPQDSRVLQDEYKLLAGLFERLEDLDSPDPVMSPDVPDVMRTDSYKKFKKFLSDVADVLQPDDPKTREKKLNRVSKTMDGLFYALVSIHFPYGMDFSDSEKIADFRQEFTNLANLTRILRDIERAVYPDMRENSAIEAAHNIFDAAVKVYGSDQADTVPDRLVSRYILDQLGIGVGGFIAQRGSIGLVIDTLNEKYADRFRIIQKPEEIAARVDLLLKDDRSSRELERYYIGKDSADKNAKAPVCPIDNKQYYHGLPPAADAASIQESQEWARRGREEARLAERRERLQVYREANRARAENVAENMAVKQEQKPADGNPKRRRASEFVREIRGIANPKPSEKKESAEAKPLEKQTVAGDRNPAPAANPNRRLATELQEEIRGGVKPKTAESKRSEALQQKSAEKKEPMEKKGPAEKKPPEKAPSAGGMK